jgi:hypothetical protein
MGAFALSTSRVVRNPVRCQQWNASMRCGDDFNLAVTVYADDIGTLDNLTGASAMLALFRDDASPLDHHGWGAFGYGYDYGLGWFTARRQPLVLVPGVLASPTLGRVTFAIPAATTSALFGRYRLELQIAGADGCYTQIEGVLQVRAGLGAGLLAGAPSLSIGPGVLSAATPTPTPVPTPMPIASLGVSGLTFASTNVGSGAAAQSLVVTNTGPVPLIITAITTTGDFSVTGSTSP